MMVSVKIFTRDPPSDGRACERCRGRGVVPCAVCSGEGCLGGRVRILGPGVWPRWCAECRASGASGCGDCYGTGKYREPIGFRL